MNFSRFKKWKNLLYSEHKKTEEMHPKESKILDKLTEFRAMREKIKNAHNNGIKDLENAEGFEDAQQEINDDISNMLRMTMAERLRVVSQKTEAEQRALLSNIAIVAFVGASGTGKSTRALKVARDYQIDYLIDDGLLIHGSRIIAGTSAKKAPTKMESVRQALFLDATRSSHIRRALMEYLPPILMILGTSFSMLEKICNNLWLNQPVIRIKIEDVSTEEERLLAKHTRLEEGKHTIPVPSMEIKHDFSGYFADPISRLRKKLDKQDNMIASEMERSVVRPTFSTLGDYSISDEAMHMMVNIILAEIEGVAAVLKFRLKNEAFGTQFRIEVALYYGYNAQKVMQEIQSKVTETVEYLTAINVVSVNIKAGKVIDTKRKLELKEG